ncbi:MAG: hotdog domain-containing protein [Rudaea sp.]
MNRDAAARAYFDERRVVPENAAPAFVEGMCCESHASSGHAGVAGMDDPAADAWLLATLQTLTTCELSRFLDGDDEMPVTANVDCRYWAPLAAGAEVRLVGWIDAIDANSATFRAQVHDAQGLVCEARIEFGVVAPTAVDRALASKRAALARRKLFAPA